MMIRPEVGLSSDEEDSIRYVCNKRVFFNSDVASFEVWSGDLDLHRSCCDQ